MVKMEKEKTIVCPVFIGHIIDIFDDYLGEKNHSEEAQITGKDYDKIADKLSDTIRKWCGGENYLEPFSSCGATVPAKLRVKTAAGMITARKADEDYENPGIILRNEDSDNDASAVLELPERGNHLRLTVFAEDNDLNSYGIPSEEFVMSKNIYRNGILDTDDDEEE